MAESSPDVLDVPALKKPVELPAPQSSTSGVSLGNGWAGSGLEGAPPRDRTPFRALVLVSVGLNVLLALGVVVIATGLERRLDALAATTTAQAAVNAAHTESLSKLTENADLTRRGLADLNTAVSSHAREEALFLKALILKPSLDQQLARRIAQLVHAKCELFGQDPNLVLAIMAVESDFNPKAVSNVGALGLMQVMPHWKKVLGLTADLTDPEVSIHAGIQILGFYQQMYGEVAMALTAYNRGPGPVDSALMRGASPANGYEAKVLATYERLKGLDAQRP